MKFLVVGLCGLVVAELLFRLPLARSVKTIAGFASKARRTVASKTISDHWKERILPAYAMRMGVASLAAFGWLLLAFSPFLFLGILWPQGGLSGLTTLLLEWQIAGALTALCGGYALFRNRIARSKRGADGDSSAYGPLDRLLHRMVLGAPILPELMHDLERAAFLKPDPTLADKPHVFVTGLARAGTTVLLRELGRTDAFGTLTYMDMPFVLAPNLWARLGGAKAAGEPQERAHGDGIAVNAESPEAFDEVFWRVHDGSAYIRKDRLLPHKPDQDVIDGFTDLMALVLRCRGKNRYLSKNNNNILRLDSLATAYQNAQFLVAFRDPLQHANSLLRQHQRFLVTDAFTADYMTWLGHHEFGRTHRPFAFDGLPEGDAETLDYWLQVWLKVYGRIAELSAPNLIMVDPEQLAVSQSARDKLAARLMLQHFDLTEMRAIPHRDVPSHSAELAAKAYAIHASLREKVNL